MSRTDRLTNEQFLSDMKGGKSKCGVFVNAASPYIAELLSFAGYDWILIDAQHGPMDTVTLTSMLAAVSNGRAKSLIRVSGHTDRAGIQQAVDLGVDGVLVPYVNNKKDVEEAIGYMMYPPEGTRSMYVPTRAMFNSGFHYFPKANKELMVAVQIETAASIENIDEILSVPRVDIAFLGAGDLSLSMGLHLKYPNLFASMASEEMQTATTKLIDTANKYGKVLGGFVLDPSAAGPFMAKGFRFVVVGSDLFHLTAMAGITLKGVRASAKSVGIEYSHVPTALWQDD